MANAEDRLRSLEDEHSEEPCPACGGKVIFEEHQPGGGVFYPMGTPCNTCGSAGIGGRPGKVVVRQSEYEPDDGDEDEV